MTFNPFTGNFDFTGMSQTEADARYAQLAAANIFSVNGAASTPALSLTGSVFTGGSGTSTKPLFLIEPAGTTAATTWSTAGTPFGLNTPSGFAGNLVDFKVGGNSQVSINSAGTLVFPFAEKVIWSNGYAGMTLSNGGYSLAINNAGLSLDALAPLTFSSSNGSSKSVLTPGSTGGSIYFSGSDNAFAAKPFSLFLMGSGTENSTNYERLSITTSLGEYEIKPEAGGTGSLRSLLISGLPISSSGLASGTLWNNLGIVNVA